jgi:NodT family efflux transporter outer membrane factor (OMF) lipoprotein
MMSAMPERLVRTFVASACAAVLAGCAVGPNYHRPSLQVAPAYKEKGWNPAKPADLAPRGDWWTLFNDPTLNTLAERVAISNQNVAVAEAAYRQSEALVREQRAALFPTLGANASATRSGGGGGGGATIVPGGGTSAVVTSGRRSTNTYSGNVVATWAPDIWGRIRRSVESARGNAQASQADLAGAVLSAQGSLASDYLDLRMTDGEIALLTAAVDNYQRNLQITTNRFNAGIIPHSDVLQAQSQLSTTQAELADLTRARAVFEHAIAVLVGQAPETFSIAAEPNWSPTVPEVPAGIPSALLQRRPDVAAAERRAASASAQIGVAVAAYFPNFNFSGNYGFTSSELGRVFSASNSLWSFGLSAAEAVFEGGLRGAQVAAARANYDAAVADYRQTALAAFQEVEDQLAATRVLAQEYVFRKDAADAAGKAAVMVLNQYRAGQVDYTSVVTAQNTALTAEQSVLQAANGRQVAAVALIQALGGGWTAPF